MSSLSLVRYRTNGYSVPVAYGHRDVIVRGCVGQVVIGQAVISCGSEVIAKHPRSYERDDFVFDPIHYLPLLEQKTGALAIGWRRSHLAFLLWFFPLARAVAGRVQRFCLLIPSGVRAPG